MTDEELQDSVEQGKFPERDDAHTYRLIFDALKREPEFTLPENFATRVIERWDAKYPQESHEMFWFYTGIVACIMAMVVAVVITDFKFSFGALRFISGYPGLVSFAVLFVLSLQWLDRKIIRKAS